MKNSKSFLIVNIIAIFKLIKTESPLSNLQDLLVYETVQNNHNLLHNGKDYAADTDSKNLNNDINSVQDDLNLKLFRIEVARLCKKTGKCYCEGNVCNFYKSNNFEDIKSELVKIIQRTSERICRTTGRCGCTGNRCEDSFTGSYPTDKVQSLYDKLDYNDVSDTLIDKINNRLRNNIPNTFGISESNTKSLRNEEVDRLCRQTGRCGCTGTRCGDSSSNLRSHKLFKQLGLSSPTKDNKIQANKQQILSYFRGSNVPDNYWSDETINKYLRNEEENRLCIEAGRCGCTGNRCGDVYYRTNQKSPNERDKQVLKNLDHQIDNLLQDKNEYQKQLSEIANSLKGNKIQKDAARCGCTGTRSGNFQSRFKVKKKRMLRKPKLKKNTKKDSMLKLLTKKIKKAYKLILGLFKSSRKHPQNKSYRLRYKENVDSDVISNKPFSGSDEADMNEIYHTMLEYNKQLQAILERNYMDEAKTFDHLKGLKEPTKPNIENIDILIM